MIETHQARSSSSETQFPRLPSRAPTPLVNASFPAGRNVDQANMGEVERTVRGNLRSFSAPSLILFSRSSNALRLSI